MTTARGIIRGAFGRIALLDMDTCLVPHAHHHCHMILKASGHDQTFSVENQSLPVRADTAVLVNSWESHNYVHSSDSTNTVVLALYIEPSWLAAMDPAFRSCASRRFFDKPCVAIGPEIQALRAALVDTLNDDLNLDTAALDKRIVALTSAIAHRYGNDEPSTAEVSDRVGDFRIRRALRHIRENVHRPLELDEVAAVAGLSRPHFNVLFRKSTGLSPAVYGNALRVEAAVHALGQQKAPISAIADTLGFSAQSNFARFFQQHTGISPNHFRRVVAEIA